MTISHSPHDHLAVADDVATTASMPGRTTLVNATTALRPLADIPFESIFVATFPGDAMPGNASRQVRNVAYSRVDPTPVSAPRLLAWSDDVGALLGIERPGVHDDIAIEALAGNQVLPGMAPYAARYGGHQFGHWAGQLGDGRAITLGEMRDIAGHPQELQLKGAGRTPYSRTADGRAVLRSSVREYMCSEAMHFLGVPTTRALSLVATGEDVVRDMFYDGHARPEPGAIVCRVAPTFIRFGNFEILAAQDEPRLRQQLANHVIARHFPELGTPSPATYAAWYREICRRTALLMSEWMRVGFVHGVMNTDNMSILGLTIDYGPYGWLEGFDPLWTPNTTDAQGRRYRYGQQPQIGHWNLARLGQALAPLFDDAGALDDGLNAYSETFHHSSTQMLAAKLGLAALDADGDDALVTTMTDLLQRAETDMTLFFRGLANVPVHDAKATDDALLEPLRAAFYDEASLVTDHRDALAAWLRQYAARTRTHGTVDAARIATMNAVNPRFVLRNYMAQLAIDALEQDDPSVLERIMRVLHRPYDDQPEHDDLAARRPEWARNRAGCSALSCSS